jgi:hypothetical protein
VKAERLKRTTDDYANRVPDLIFEVRSKTDDLDILRAKIRQFLDLGTTVGALVDYRIQTIEVYRREGDPMILQNGDRFTVPERLPGWTWRCRAFGHRSLINLVHKGRSKKATSHSPRWGEHNVEETKSSPVWRQLP